MLRLFTFFIAILLATGCSSKVKYDVIIRNGDIYDGSGKAHYKADIGIIADTVAVIGDLSKSEAAAEIDATGLAVAPGFINMLSWANESLIEDGRSMGDILQGVTLEVLGEGESMGPLNEQMKADMKNSQSDIRYDVSWTSLGEYLDFLVKKGVSANVASFIGTQTVRVYTVGYDDRPPTTAELDSMKLLVRQAMEEGAVGVSSALQYVPASFAEAPELEALASVAKEYDGMYITHVRDEGAGILPAVDEAIKLASATGIRTEIYHLKQSGSISWPLIDDVIRKIDSTRAAGLHITADMYNYIASSTGFDIVMPAWVQEGGFDKWRKRLMDPAVRRRIAPEIHKSLMERTGSAEKVLVIGFNTDSLRYLTGKNLAEIAAMRKRSPGETIMDLVIQDNSRIGVVYFSMSEENVKRQIALPWMAFCSDGGSYATEGVFLKFSTHPRAYGNFSRLLGKYVRDEKVISLEEAVHKLSEFPAANLKLDRRGSLKPGYFADIVVFDANIISDKATFEKPHQYAVGMEHVFVNGVQVVRDGEHTGAKPGRFVHGPGYRH